MLCEASSLAMVRAMPTTPCLAATYGARYGMPLIPAVELGQMIDPPPAAIRFGAHTTIVFHTLVHDRLQRGRVAHVRRRGDDPAFQRLDRLHRVVQVCLGGEGVAHRAVVPADVDREDVGALL